MTDKEVNYDDIDWKNLPPEIQKAAGILGYTKRLWDNDINPPSCDKWWSDLTPAEERACLALGYKKEEWDAHSDSSDDEDEADLPPNVICVQIYVETEDYILKFGDTFGLSMYANRDLGADEAFFQSVVAPYDNNMEIFGVSNDGEASKRRGNFMRRFLAWQELTGNKSGVGASQVERPKLTAEDFERKSKVRCISHLPTASNPSYTFVLRENDYCVIEFIPNPNYNNGSATLPKDRCFEVLRYDEGIYWDGEECYDPAKVERPPSLSDHDRTLELPGHFSNHACGIQATIYDTFRLRRDGDKQTCGAVVAPWQPEKIQKELEAYVSTNTFPKSMYIANVMTTNRPMEKGDEVTTDYALWHWSDEDFVLDEMDIRAALESIDFGNADYLTNGSEWDELPPKVRDAALYLGYSKTIWNSRQKPAIKSKLWKQLSLTQKITARTIGYDNATWDNVSESEENMVAVDTNRNINKMLAPRQFQCICGSPECHSKNGFKGVQSFPLEEQRRLCLICSPWIQNNIEWKLYQMKHVVAGNK